MRFLVTPPSWKARLNRHALFWLVGVVLTPSLLAGCTIPAAPDAQTPDTPVSESPLPADGVPEGVSDRVLAQAAADLNVSPDELSIQRFNREVWQDSCLGLGQPYESCLQTLVEGWQLEVVNNDESYFYRTDATADAIRRSDLANNLPPSIRDQVLTQAASDAGIPVEQLEVTAAEPQVWDGCLGVAAPGTVCTQIAIFGWRVVVQGGGETLVYHTDMMGADIRRNDQ